MPVAKCAVLKSRDTTTSCPSREPSLYVASFMAALSDDSSSSPQGRRRLTALAALSIAIAALHGWGLHGMAGLAAKDDTPPTPDFSVTVRSIELPPPPPALSEAPPPPSPPPPPEPAPPVPRAPSPQHSTLPKALDPSLPPTAPEPPASAAPPPPAPPEALASAPSAESVPPAPPLQADVTVPGVGPATELMSEAPNPADSGGTIVGLPVYPTQLPPSGSWQYRLQRGLLSGTAELRWELQADGRYGLALDGTVAGVNVLKWRSQGVSGPFGATPERFTVQRRNRAEVAANFDRESREISFSGSTGKIPWVTGVQDRLSWMVQLPAIIAADPSRYPAGAGVLLMVVSASGGAELWQFTVEGEESLDGVPTLKLQRMPSKTSHKYATRAQVWLDPARGHMPLRAILTQGEDGNALQLDLLP